MCIRDRAYTVSEAGSDRQRLRIRDTATGEDLEDQLDHLRFTSVAWYGEGFFYTRWPRTEPGSTAPVRDPSVHFHRIGDSQDADQLIFRNADDPEPSYHVSLTQDDRYLVLTESRGTSNKYGILYLDLALADLNGPDQPDGWVRLVEQGEALHSVLLHHDNGFIVHTDRDAPNGAIVHLSFDGGPPNTLVAESEFAIEGAAGIAGQLLVLRLEDASHTISRHDLNLSLIHI